MFTALTNSWTLAKECWSVLMHDKEMLVYPTLTSVVNLLIFAIAYFYMLGAGLFDAEQPFQFSNLQWIIGASIVLAAMYSAHFSFSFFECALVASALKRLKGDNPSLGYGLRVAANRIPQIAGWSLYSTLFGILLSIIKGLFKSRFAQKVVGGITETAWNVVTVFVLPLIVVENIGSFDAVKKSVSIIKHKWGEAATLEIGFGSLCSIAAIPIAGFFILAGFIHAGSPMLASVLIGIGVLLCVVLGLVFAALSGISKAVLYNFAVGGKLPNEVHDATIDNAVTQNNPRSSIVEGRTQT